VAARHDPFNLERFLKAQEGVYERALAELRRGRKESHWMWFVFPQIDGLGHSSTAKFYALKSREEAVAYLADPILGQRLRECVDALLGLEGRSVEEIFGYPDHLKLKSSITLFALVSSNPLPFEQVLAKYFQQQKDARTVELLGA